jgi:hypothetical protein
MQNEKTGPARFVSHHGLRTDRIRGSPQHHSQSRLRGVAKDGYDSPVVDGSPVAPCPAVFLYVKRCMATSGFSRCSVERYFLLRGPSRAFEHEALELGSNERLRSREAK